MGAPLLVFADDWGRHPSSAQHLIRQLLPHRRVAWINTIGTRKPRLDRETLVRGLEKFRHWFKPKPDVAPLPANLSVTSPRMWPWFTHAWDRTINQKLLKRNLKKVVSALAAAPVVVTTLPITADLVGAFPARRWIYYCVDDFSVWPGLDGGTMQTMERQLLRKVDRIIAVSEELQRRIRDMGRESHLLTHGVDLPFWRPRAGAVPAEFASLPRPIALFWGVIDRRMDIRFLKSWSAHCSGTMLLVGPQNEPDPAIRSIPRVVIGPPQAVEQLPILAGIASVLVMPYADLPVTRAMQPLKLKEYLATNLPVVARDLPANRAWADCMDLVASPETFTQLLQLRVHEGMPHSQRQARERLQNESWSEKSRIFEHLIDDTGAP